MKIEDIMIQDVKWCAASDSVSRAAQIMWENDCGCVPVVDSNSEVVGMLTDRDVCMAAYTQGATLNGIPASSAMSREVFACRPSDDLLAAQRMMREHQVRRLPVTDAQGKLVGIVSLSDIARAVADAPTGKVQIASTLLAICAPHRSGAEPESVEVQGQHQRRSRERRRRRTPPSEPLTERKPGA